MTEQKAPANAGAKVTVACKLPHGLELRLFDMVEVSMPVLGGGYRTVSEARVRSNAGSVFIRGNAVAVGSAPSTRIIKKGGAPFHDGFALTTNVSKDFWDLWLKQNKDHPAVVNNLIFAMEKSESVVSEAKVRAGDKNLRSGLEPIAQKGDPRMPRKIAKATVGVGVEEDEAA